MRTYTYETTWEQTDDLDNVVGSAELRIHYTFSPGCADYYVASIGGPGGWQPGYPPELDILKIEEEDFSTGKAVWREIAGKFPDGRDRFEYYREWAESEHFENMAQEAFEARADAAADAAEHAMELRAERRLEESR